MGAPRQLGTSDIRISPIVMGMWQAGKEMWTGINDAEIRRAVNAAVEAGINAFDTAEMYGKGHSERMLAAATAGIRDKVVIMTKVFSNHLQYDQVIAACNRSLKNLNTDRIDLYQIHWPSGSWGGRPVAIEETMRALNDLKAQGKIRAIGVSNFSRTQLEEATGFGRIDSFQPPYSLFWRHVEKDTMSYCQANNVTILAYSPMAQGILTGKFGAQHRFEKGDHRAGHRLFQPDMLARVQQALGRLRPIAERQGVTLAQLALAWVISHLGTCAIAGARSAAQVTDNAAAARVDLTPDDLAEMDAISRTVTDHLDDNPVQWSS
ncbi:MAG: aldo/keto reductase [Syntrophobacterales bacterium]|nr:MAG: aldo/keto reductase [Syntrophobacterales bacterium]